MSTGSRIPQKLCIAVAGGLLLAASAGAAKAQIVIPIPPPTAEYASLPSNDRVKEPATTGSLPTTARISPDLSPGFRGSVDKGAITLRDTAPTGCLPGNLREVVADVAAKFGPVSVESTHRSRGRNARAGGADHSLHLACRAVDFRIHGRSRGVMAYLSARSDVGGLKMYRNGIIHIDNGSRRSW